jgi:cytidine deaminase
MKPSRPAHASAGRLTARVRTMLLTAARAASRHAYCPYSHFPVGAALLGADGRIFTGCNVENASYGLTLCAERAALTRAVGEGVRDFRALAVAGGRGTAVTPCGACRQSLAEFCPDGLPILLTTRDADGPVTRVNLQRLLPSSFSLPSRK